jgi:hypothetical protein
VSLVQVPLELGHLSIMRRFSSLAPVVLRWIVPNRFWNILALQGLMEGAKVHEYEPRVDIPPIQAELLHAMKDQFVDRHQICAVPDHPGAKVEFEVISALVKPCLGVAPAMSKVRDEAGRCAEGSQIDERTLGGAHIMVIGKQVPQAAAQQVSALLRRFRRVNRQLSADSV